MTLVDTSAWVAFLQGTGTEADREVDRLLRERIPIQTTATITLELLAGAANEGEVARLAELLDGLERVAPPDPLDIERAAYLYRTLREGSGSPPSLASCLIAAVAFRDNLDVLAETPHFERLARVSGLRLTGRDAREPGRVEEAEHRTATDPTSATSVLLVEDDSSDARLLHDALGGSGFEISIVGSGRDARTSISEVPPDVIVLDLILPDEDGRTLLGDLRNTDAARRMGVVVVTGKAGPRTEEECLALGADGFLEKPVDPEALRAAVRQALELGRSGAHDQLARTPILAEASRARAGRRQDAPARTGPTTETVALIRVDAGAGDRALPVLLRAAIDVLGREVREEETVARWGIDGLVILSPSRDAHAIGQLCESLSATPELRGHLNARVRSVGVDEDLLDAVSRMDAALGEADGPSIVSVGAGSVPTRTQPVAALVEDDPVTAGLVQHRLERSGFQIQSFVDGAVALEAILAAPPDVVVLDVQLPSMDGFEVLGRMREHASARSVPVLMFTTLGRQEHVARAFELGANDYVTKPFSPSDLLTRVLRLVRKR